ncbi:MAG TPA: GNAT family N-acetyltransferase [Opitutaceae bacterium]
MNKSGERWVLRLASGADISALETLIAESVTGLQASHYTRAQREAAIGDVFGVDRQLIRDGTYFVALHRNRIVGCGGWSRRASLCGSDRGRTGEDSALDPRSDPARLRAFFVHPDWARRGIGRAIVAESERAIAAMGFGEVVVAATLPGEPLYAACGYSVVEHFAVSLSQGLQLPVVRMAKRLSMAGKRAPQAVP